MEHVEFECPDCGTLHYATWHVTCDCRAADEAFGPRNAKGGGMLIGGWSREHAPTCPCHDCFMGRDGLAR